MKKETLVSIAERSGCSISTVSRVLSGNAAKYRISQRTVARVTEEVKRCNYTPSLLAKGLRTNRTDTIGLLIPNIENSFFAGVAGVVIRESRNYNYKVVVVDTQEDERNEQDGIRYMLMGFFQGPRNLYQHNHIGSGVSNSISVIIEASFFLHLLDGHSITQNGRWIPETVDYREIYQKMPKRIDRWKLVRLLKKRTRYLAKKN